MFVESLGLCGFDLPLRCVLGCLTFQSKHKNKQPRLWGLGLDGWYRHISTMPNPVCVCVCRDISVCVRLCFRVIWFLLSLVFRKVGMFCSFQIFYFMLDFWFHLISSCSVYVMFFESTTFKTLFYVTLQINWYKIYWHQFCLQDKSCSNKESTFHKILPFSFKRSQIRHFLSRE